MHECSHPFAVFMLGAETPHWRKLLNDNNAGHVGINFKALRQRMNKSGIWSVEEHFPEDTHVLVDAGSTKEGDDYEHNSQAAVYEEWVKHNIDRISLVVEYDAPSLGLDWAISQRESWDSIPAEKFLPIWHETYGLDHLEDLAGKYPRVAISKPSGSLEGRLRSIVARTGVRLHGLGISGPDDINSLPLATVSSTSWISPSRYGDTQVFSGGRFHWYPARSKTDARRRHRNDVDQAGFDGEAFVNGDAHEVARYTIWAWQEFEADVAKHRGTPDAKVITISRAVDHSATGNTDDHSVGHSANHAGMAELVVREADKLFPGLSMRHVKPASGQASDSEGVLVVSVGETGLRSCNSCSLRARCPVFLEDATCRYKMPIQIRTKDELQSTLSSLLEMQLGRVLFARANEEAMGDVINPDVSKEIKLYMDLVAKVKEIESDSSYLSIKATGPAAGGLISQLLGATKGAQAERNAQALDPDKTERLMRNLIDIPTNDDI